MMFASVLFIIGIFVALVCGIFCCSQMMFMTSSAIEDTIPEGSM